MGVMKESTKKVVLPLGLLALTGTAVYWLSSPAASRETEPPPSLASLTPPGFVAGTTAASMAPATLKAATEEDAPDAAGDNKSSFRAARVRDPFWPIGWTKADAEKSTAVDAPPLSPDAFNLTSVAIGAKRRFVILNHKVLRQGQRFVLQFEKKLYEVTVKAIHDGRVILAYQGGEIVVPLQRK